MPTWQHDKLLGKSKTYKAKWQQQQEKIPLNKKLQLNTSGEFRYQFHVNESCGLHAAKSWSVFKVSKKTSLRCGLDER